MNVLVLGATGTIGRAVVRAPETSHHMVKASRTGPVTADPEDPASLDALFPEVARAYADAVEGTAQGLTIRP